MKVTIIGAAGKMGEWFTRYFAEKKNEIVVYDVNYAKVEKIAKELGAKNVENMISAVKEADVILIAVPISITADTVLEVAKLAKKDAIIVEIASFKERIINACKKTMKKNIIFLSVHPMFGPGAKNLLHSKMIVVTVIHSEQEVEETKKIFPDADVVPASPKEHDEAMAIILSLTHFINFTYAFTLSSKDLESLRRLSGTTFNLQLTLAESILHDGPEFLTTLQLDNKYAAKEIHKFVKMAESLENLTFQNEKEKLISKLINLRSTLEKDKNYNISYKKMYEIIDILLMK